MLLNYFKLAVRLLLRNPFFSLINILGLSLGFAAFLALWQHTTNELKSDQFHNDFQNKVRLAFTWTTRDDHGVATETAHGLFAPGFAEYLTSERADFQNYSRLYQQVNFSQATIGDHGQVICLSRVTTTQQPVAFKEKNLAYADPNFFEFFSIPLLAGNAGRVLQEPSSIVLSSSMAKKYFGGENPINSVLLLNDSIALKVTGVFKDLPHNTHLIFDALISMKRIRGSDRPSDGNGATLYFEVNPNARRAELDQQIDATAKKFSGPAMKEFGINPDDIHFYTQPLDEIAFSKFNGDTHPGRSRTILIALQVIAVVTLITAWINYLNLVIYANSKRMKELGVRRTSGAKNSDFITQFILESLIINAVSLVGAMTLLQGAKGILQDVFQVYLSSGGGVSTKAILAVSTITVLGIVITGVYPALNVMNKSTRNIFTDGHRHTFYLGKWLTVFQFSIAVILIIGVFGVYQQLNYILTRDLGLRRDHVIVLDLPENSKAYPKSSLDALLNHLSTLSGVADFALSSSVPGDSNPNGIGIQRTTGSEFVGTDTNGGVDERFLPFFDIKLLAGRNFVNNDPGNEHAIIVSRKLLQRLGLGESEGAVGQTILVESKGWTHDMVPTKIIGVIEDYKRRPLLSGLSFGWLNDDGVALTYHDNVDAENTPQKISILINHKNLSETLREVEHLYSQFFSTSFFNWYFLSDNVNQHYQKEKITRNQVVLFTLLAVGIACLGLLGMIANKAEEKTKEIGIRKVLGARLPQIAQLLIKTTLLQIVIASLVGIPAAHLMIEEYLKRYSDRITLQWWHYLVPLAALLLILFITVASTIKKAAKTNPIDSLRYE